MSGWDFPAGDCTPGDCGCRRLPRMVLIESIPRLSSVSREMPVSCSRRARVIVVRYWSGIGRSRPVSAGTAGPARAVDRWHIGLATLTVRVIYAHVSCLPRGSEVSVTGAVVGGRWRGAGVGAAFHLSCLPQSAREQLEGR